MPAWVNSLPITGFALAALLPWVDSARHRSSRRVVAYLLCLSGGAAALASTTTFATASMFGGVLLGIAATDVTGTFAWRDFVRSLVVSPAVLPPLTGSLQGAALEPAASCWRFRTASFGSRSLGARSQQPGPVFLAVLVALLVAVPVGARADKFPDYLGGQYRSYFARFVDDRSLSEQMLNAVRLTSRDHGRSFALIAGISKYPQMSGASKELIPAAEDVRKLVDYLITYEKFDEVVVLRDSDVTDANLIYFLQRYFPRRLQEFPRSRFLFAYSGHGATLNNRGFLLTPDARNLTDVYNAIPMHTVRAMFQPIVDSGFHVLALINACYSGDFLKRSFGGETRFIPKYSGAHAITAGGTGELTWHDGAVGTGSVFFEKFFAALDGRAGRDGIVTVDDLAAYLRREVQISTDQQQNPLPGDLSRDGSLGGFFFFNRRPLVEARILPAWDGARGHSFGGASGDRAGRPSPQRDLESVAKRGFASLENKDFDDAIVEFTDAIQILKDTAPHRHLDIAVMFTSRGDAYFAKQDLDRAMNDYDEAIQLSPDFTNPRHKRGAVLHQKKDFDGAIREYSESIRLDPKVATVWDGRGRSYYMKQNYSRAIGDFSQAIELDPNYAPPLLMRGAAKIQMGDVIGGEADAEAARRMDPSLRRR